MSGISVSDVEGIESSQIFVAGSVFILSGGNASGKTRLLRALYEHAGDESKQRASYSFESDQGASTVYYVDPHVLVARQMASINADESLDERVDSAEFALMRAAETRSLSYVVGRNYEKFEVAELDADGADSVIERLGTWGASAAIDFAPDVLPYFRVERLGRTYYSQEMSLGELTAATLIWALARTESGGTLFIEEPDAALSPVSSIRCLDTVAAHAYKNELLAFVTSHSANGLGKIPTDRILLLDRTGSGTSELIQASALGLLRELEVPLAKYVLFVVEDAAGAQWLREIVAKELPHISGLLEILPVGGESKVKATCAIPDEIDEARTIFWGVLDGDQRNERWTARSSRIAFLPGSVPPEDVVKNFVLGCALDINIGFDIEAARRAFARAEGRDIHDQVSDVAGELGVSVAHFRSRVWSAYAETDSGREEVTGLVSSINEIDWSFVA